MAGGCGSRGGPPSSPPSSGSPGIRLGARALPALAAIVGWAIACTGGSGRDIPRPGRIVLLSMDTVRADRIGGYGDADTTPNLLEIAARGSLFRNFYASSTYTIPSHASIFTGLDPEEHGMMSDVARINPGIPTLAEQLRRAGYRTQAFHEGGFVAARFGFDRGFDAYEVRGRLAVVDAALPEVLAWMRASAEEPYFLFLHTYAAHPPYGGFERYRSEHPERGLPSDEVLQGLRGRGRPLDPGLRELCLLHNVLAGRYRGVIRHCGRDLPTDFPESPWFELDRDAMRTSYDERIRLIDRALGRIRETLVELGQWEDTLLIVLSDHGEAFFEHGLQEHDYVPFEEVLRIPLVISYPRLLAGRGVRVVEGLAWHPDILPTVLRLAGVPAPDSLTGIDLTDAMLGRAPIPEQRAIFPVVLRPATRPQEPLRRVALEGELKRVEGHERFGDAAGLLFDLASDPMERHNLREARRDRFDALARRTAAYTANLHPLPPLHQRTLEPIPSTPPASPGVELSAEAEAKLRTLGYLGSD